MHGHLISRNICAHPRENIGENTARRNGKKPGNSEKRRIDERPAIVERRSRLGDWEGDTMLGRDKRVRIVTFVDRKSGYLIAYLLPKMRAELLASLAVARFRHVPKEKRRTLTLDNGIEFSAWERIEEKTGMTVYFAYPYHAWERGIEREHEWPSAAVFPRRSRLQSHHSKRTCSCGEAIERSAKKTPQIQKSATDISERLICAVRVQIQVAVLY